SKSKFTIYGNIIYYLLIKNKRVTKSILILKVYSIVNDINLTYAILITLRRITNRLSLLPILTVIYTNSYLLYKYLVKLGIIKKKRIIINIITLK
ncbi:hypothetical protein CCUS01_08903, partial [Colletotrichum cuscutae]